MAIVLPSGEILPMGEEVPRLPLRSLSEKDDVLVDERPRDWFSITGVVERPREVVTSGGKSNDGLWNVGGDVVCVTACVELTRGTATAAEGGGIDEAPVCALNSAGEGVLDLDLDRDLDLDDLSSSTTPRSSLMIISGDPKLRPPTTLAAPPCAYLSNLGVPSLASSSTLNSLRPAWICLSPNTSPKSGPPK
jgi:hypothetical protein